MTWNKSIYEYFVFLEKWGVGKPCRQLLLDRYKMLEVYKALAVLMRRMARISGYAVDSDERACAFRYFSRFAQQKVDSVPISMILEMVYDSLDDRDLEETASEAMGYLFLLDKRKAYGFMFAMFELARTTDGIIFPELSFAHKCVIYAGLSEIEFQGLCRDFSERWSLPYEGETIYGGAEGKAEFLSERESFWNSLKKMVETGERPAFAEENTDERQDKEQSQKSDDAKRSREKERRNRKKSRDDFSKGTAET